MSEIHYSLLLCFRDFFSITSTGISVNKIFIVDGGNSQKKGCIRSRLFSIDIRGIFLPSLALPVNFVFA